MVAFTASRLDFDGLHPALSSLETSSLILTTSPSHPLPSPGVAP